MLELSKEEKESVLKETQAILESNEKDPANLIPILQKIQNKLLYLPGPAMEKVAETLEIPEVDVYEIATFYNEFRLYPPGETQLKVCMGTACYMVGGEIVMDSFERRLDINEGETTSDRKYSLERVACVGCCSLAPVVVTNDEIEGHVTPTRVDGLLFGAEGAPGADSGENTSSQKETSATETAETAKKEGDNK